MQKSNTGGSLPSMGTAGPRKPWKPKYQTVSKVTKNEVAIDNMQKQIQNIEDRLRATQQALLKETAKLSECEKLRSRCEISKQQMDDRKGFNLNTREDLTHFRGSGRKYNFESMLRDQRISLGFNKQLSSDCKRCMKDMIAKYSEFESKQSALRKLLKQLTSSEQLRISADEFDRLCTKTT